MSPTLTEARFGTGPARGLVDHVNAIELDDETAAVAHYIRMDLAHVLMLTQEGIFREEQGAAITAALLRLLDTDPRTVLACDPAIGTLGLQIERYLEEQCGPSGLDIQRARSRIDQKSTGIRLADREALLHTMDALLRLGEALLAASERHDAVLAPGYTHLQHAQPTTLGHYFNAQYWPVARALDRMTHVLRRLDECPLGGAAHSGTSWPINREATASYLGFTRPVRNARDAGLSAQDGGAEIAAVLGLSLAGAARCASDLFYWSSSEVGLVSLSAALCGTSSMMPQKRNPIVLERIRGLAGEAAGWTASQLGTLHSATSTDADQAYVHNRIPGYCRESAGAFDLLAEAVMSLEVDEEALRVSAGRHWSTASALADDLVRTRGLSFRQAHEAVARYIATQERHAPSDPAPAPVELAGYAPEDLARILDADAFVESRISQGGTSTGRREELAREARLDLDQHHRGMADLHARIAEADTRLLRDAAALAATHSA
ncbi:argininosuccinate lyase [Streptomyces sp. NPDC019224]|uniref:argininosuccinate lyase n=1 Tax=Streptomyces sp. NPDC019224 TaxID=3154484 RepID=UPI0033FDA899